MRLRRSSTRSRRPGWRAGRRWAPPVALAGALVLAGVAGYLLLGSGLFRATDVAVQGHQRLSAAAVRSAAGVPGGTPLVMIDTAAIARRVSDVPAVAAVDVRRRWPHTVRISVIERVPLLAVPRGSRFALLDAAGVPFAAMSSPPRRLPVATLRTVSSSDPTTKAVLGVLRALDPELRAAVRRLDASSDSGVTLVLRDGRRVVWGANDHTAEKAEVLPALLKRAGRVYDVSAPDVVTVTR
jgi:cell division protein FtsQ